MGCGINISKLRPNEAIVNNSALTSSGSVSFMDLYNTVGKIIGASNKKKGETSARRAALMIGLDCTHPDLEEFLEIKKNNTELQSANISILYNDDFMKAVENNEEYTLSFKTKHEFITKVINARDFFMKVAGSNWDFAEPGAIFINNVRNNNLLSGYPREMYNISISNPCSEFFGNAYNSCNLGSINLYNIVNNPFTKESVINYTKLVKLTRLGVMALDEILSYGYDMQPLEENRKCIDDWRSIGLGVFGLADMFIALGVKYGSPESLEITNSIMSCIMKTALEQSIELAKEKGSFGKYDFDYIMKSPIIQKYPELHAKLKKCGLRNGSLLAIAPTGSIGTMCGMSGGVEPLFAISYQRTTHALEKEGKYFKVFAKSVEHLLRHNGIDPESITEEEIIKRFPFVTTSHNIDPFDRIELQGIMQKSVDNAISSTINLKQEATIEDVFNIYLEAWKAGCKGITVFRNGCARTSIMRTGKEKNEISGEILFDSTTPVKIGAVDCKKIVKHTACVDKLYVFVCNDGDTIVEVFTNIIQGCTANIGTITRLTSALLRSGVTVEYVLKCLRKTKCQGCVKAREKDSSIALSCGNAIADAIEEEYKRLKGKDLEVEDSGLLICPECGKRTLKPEGKCVSCFNCNYSKCD